MLISRAVFRSSTNVTGFPRFPDCWVLRVKDTIDILDVVALTEDLPERGLYRGQVGTVVEILAPGVFEVEFSDDEGRAYASLTLEASQLLVLRYKPIRAR